MKRILITTDFSSHARYTLDYVIGLLRATHIPCSIILLNTFMVKETDPSKVIELNDRLKKNSLIGLEAERNYALSQLTGENIDFQLTSHMGSLNNVISKLLKEGPLDLVAMGKDGGKNVETVSALLKEQGCPLLVTYLKS